MPVSNQLRSRTRLFVCSPCVPALLEQWVSHKPVSRNFPPGEEVIGGNKTGGGRVDPVGPHWAHLNPIRREQGTGLTYKLVPTAHEEHIPSKARRTVDPEFSGFG